MNRLLSLFAAVSVSIFQIASVAPGSLLLTCPIQAVPYQGLKFDKLAKHNRVLGTINSVVPVPIPS